MYSLYVNYTQGVDQPEFKCMKQALTLILILIVNFPPALATELVYPDPQSTTTEENRRAGSVVIKELFRDSDFVLVSRSIPGPYRMALEMADKRLDILSAALHKNMFPLLPSEVGVIYPQPLFSVPIRYYALRDSNSSDLEGDFRLGVIYMPKPLLGSISEHPIEFVEFYNSYLAMAKGLLAKRVPQVAGSALELGAAFKDLGIEQRVVMLKETLLLDVHLVIRASLPLETKESIFALLDQRLPEFKRQDKLRSLFEKNNLDYSSVIPAE